MLAGPGRDGNSGMRLGGDLHGHHQKCDHDEQDHSADTNEGEHGMVPQGVLFRFVHTIDEG